MIDISFITINYNSSAYTIELIKSIFKEVNQEITYEIIVVDNASILEDYEKLISYTKTDDKIKVVRNTINSGFATGNMIGVNYATGEYFFFLNNDTIMLNDCASIIKTYLDKNIDIGLATGKVNDENGNFSSSYKLFPSVTKELLGNSIARKLSKDNFPSNKIKLNKPTLVEVVSGSFMFFRAKVFKEIHGFDMEFFLYCEEEDISKRILNSGNKIIFLPEASIYHASGGSTEKSFEIEREYYISYKHLIFKHFSFMAACVLLFLQIFKLFRRSFKRNNGFKLFVFAIKGFSSKESLKYKQKEIK